jgi:hypothetical protein
MAKRAMTTGLPKAGKKEQLEYKIDILPLNGPKGKILALDQSKSCTGFSYYESGEIVRHGHFKPKGKKVIESIDSLENQIIKWLEDFRPDLVIFESGGTRGMAKSHQATFSLVVCEYLVQRVCWHGGYPVGAIENERLKYTVSDKARLAKLKEQKLRASMRPIKEDVQHAVGNHWNKPVFGTTSEDYFLSADHVDSLALLLAYATDPSVVEML